RQGAHHQPRILIMNCAAAVADVAFAVVAFRHASRYRRAALAAEARAAWGGEIVHGRLIGHGVDSTGSLQTSARQRFRAWAGPRSPSVPGYRPGWCGNAGLPRRPAPDVSAGPARRW